MEGIDPNEPIVTFRKETVAKIIQKFDGHQTVMVRSPPFSGKTFLATLIKRKLELENCKVFIISMLPFAEQKILDDAKKFDETWKKALKGNSSENSEMSWSQFMDFLREHSEKSKENIYIIIDEAQIIYSQSKVWAYVKYFTQSGRNIKFLCFATYGSTIFGNIPFQFNCLLGLNDILLTHSEYKELLIAYNKFLTVKIKAEYSQLHDWLQSLTGFHIGFLKKTFLLINEEFKSNPNQDQLAILRYLLSSSYAKQMENSRAIPKPHENPWFTLVANG